MQIHGSVRFGNDVQRTHCGQDAKGLLVARLELCPRPVRMFQGAVPHGADAHLKTVMFLHAGRRFAKGMFAAKIRQHPIQSP